MGIALDKPVWTLANDLVGWTEFMPASPLVCVCLGLLWGCLSEQRKGSKFTLCLLSCGFVVVPQCPSCLPVLTQAGRARFVLPPELMHPWDLHKSARTYWIQIVGHKVACQHGLHQLLLWPGPSSTQDPWRVWCVFVSFCSLVGFSPPSLV